MKEKLKVILKNKVFYIILALIILIFGGGLYFYSAITKSLSEEQPKSTPNAKKIIEKNVGEYILYFDSTDYQRDLFTQFEVASINASSPDEALVADFVDVYTKNYLADYLTLSVKDVEYNRYGGEQFILPLFVEKYRKSNAVEDYYLSRNYYFYQNENTELLPEIASLELIEQTAITKNFSDDLGVIPNKENIPAYELTYNIVYTAPNATDFTYYETLTVTVVNWDSVWTVMSVSTGVDKEYKTVMSIY